MPKPTLDDFEVDFEGALDALAKEVMKEIAAVPPERRSAWYVSQSARRLARMIEIEAPAIIIEQEETVLARRLRRRARERRQSAGEKST